ncbi:MAG: hypothetical protein EBX09_07275 [Actinobacteria bacterium]|jgi:hypothetical protein|nr:hypothetical protein [Actinomycetota bacterium]NCX76818.1 hypothetical protein [Actinomycetota bacterium]
MTTPTTFTLAGEGNFVGINQDLGWNGWACPLFTIDVVKQIADLVAEQSGDDIEDRLTVHDDGTVTYFYAEDGETETMPTTTIDGVTYYSVMNFAWCWEVAPSDSPAVGSQV